MVLGDVERQGSERAVAGELPVVIAVGVGSKLIMR